MNNINILVLSVGRRTNLIEYFQKELYGTGNVVAADCSNLAPALYKADKCYLVPPIGHPDYLNAVKHICKQEEIVAILSLIDPELSLLAQHKDEFKEMGVNIIVSPYEACEIWLDKLAAAEFCEQHGFKVAKTYKSLADFNLARQNKQIDFPVFVKPRKGSASIKVNRAINIQEAQVLFESTDDMIIQELLEGQELGVDVYVDIKSNKTVSIFIKEKLAMRAGETDKARSMVSVALFKLVEDLVAKAGLIGPLDIDIMLVNGVYYILEINPRFGGGYPLAYECGANFPRYIINNLQGIENNPQIGIYDEDVYMMKHDNMTTKLKRDLKE